MAETKKLKMLTKRQVVAVAEDVLELTKRPDGVRVDRGVYLCEPPFEGAFEGAKDLQKKLPQIAKSCRVCAQGAMLLAYIHLYDGFDSLPTYNLANEAALALFSQAGLIEEAFENPENFHGLSTLEPRPRLRKMMRNIVKNGGVLRLERI